MSRSPIQPNIELASDVASLQRELKEMREELSHKRSADDAANAENEPDVQKNVKRSKKKEQEPKKHLTGQAVNRLSSQQIRTRSELMGSYLNILCAYNRYQLA